MTRWLGRNEGLLVGMSSGANVHAAREVGQRLGEGRPQRRDRDRPVRRRDQVSERAVLERSRIE